MYIFLNPYLNKILDDPEFGTYIEPDHELAQFKNPNDKYKIKFPSGMQANFTPFLTQNPRFKATADKIIEQRKEVAFEDQCSGKYYYDVFAVADALRTQLTKIVEVGVYTGGTSTILAGCIEDTNIQLDLVDINKRFLQYSYERIRRLFPEVAKRTRMFFGDIPTYVKNVLMKEQNTCNLIHHDGSHTFNEVIKDLASLYYVRDKINGLLIQDTNLRAGNIDTYVFVDAALYAVFGNDLRYYDTGLTHNHTATPAFQFGIHGTYWLANKPEGMYIPFALQQFHYPHPTIEFERFLPKKVQASEMAI